MCPIAYVPYQSCLPSRSMHYYAQFQKDLWSISQDPCTHLDLLGISQISLQQLDLWLAVMP